MEDDDDNDVLPKGWSRSGRISTELPLSPLVYALLAPMVVVAVRSMMS